MKISHVDPRLSWQGAISLETTPEFTRAWRIPFGKRALFDAALAERASTNAGVRLAFASDTRRLELHFAPCEGNFEVDLGVDGEIVSTLSTAGKCSLLWEALPAGEKRLEIWLSQRHGLAVRGLEVDEGASFSACRDTRPLWVTYGSSITHCGAAASPSQTWPGVVARGADVNHYNLGFGGQCHLDIQMAQVIRDLPADVITIGAGINIYGSGSLNARSFPAALIGSVELIRERHPKTPIGLISPIFSYDRETRPNAVGWTLQDYRENVRLVVERLRAAGDLQVFYYDGLSLFDESMGHLMPDQLHPDAEGYRQLGENFLKHIAPTLFAPLKR